MRGLILKIVHEVRWAVLLFGAGLFVVMALLTMLLPKVLGDIHRLFDKMAFVKPLITALLGVDPGEQMTAAMSQAFLWVHPTVLTLIWAHEVLYCTRMPAGEIDRGTADFLLGLPVSRWKLFCSETIGWIGSGIVVLALGYSGHLLASIVIRPEMRPPVMVTVSIMVNLFAMYLAVGGLAFLVSSLSDRRGRAMGVVFAALLASFLLNFVAQFWDPFATTLAEPGGQFPGLPLSGTKSGFSLASISLMDYYRPAIIIQSGQFPWRDAGLLSLLAIAAWSAAGIVFRRRSICTV